MPIPLESNEIWKDISGFEGYYQISNLGRVKSLSRTTKFGVGTKIISETILKGHILRCGHVTVNLCFNSKKKIKYVHTLVLEAFVCLKPDGKECLHWDGNPANNRLDNLRWGTPKENKQDMKRHGTYPEKEKNGNAKLTIEKVNEIRKLYLNKEYTQKQLSKIFNISKGSIYYIVHNLQWVV